MLGHAKVTRTHTNTVVDYAADKVANALLCLSESIAFRRPYSLARFQIRGMRRYLITSKKTTQKWIQYTTP